MVEQLIHPTISKICANRDKDQNQDIMSELEFYQANSQTLCLDLGVIMLVRQKEKNVLGLCEKYVGACFENSRVHSNIAVRKLFLLSSAG